MVPDPWQPRAFVERYNAASCSMDPAAWRLLRAGGSLAINGGEPAVGRDASLQSRRASTGPSRHAALLPRTHLGRDRIKYRWTFTGTNTGPGGTGNAVRVDGVESWTISEDGLIAASLGSYDAEEYARQLAEGV